MSIGTFFKENSASVMALALASQSVILHLADSHTIIDKALEIVTSIGAIGALLCVPLQGRHNKKQQQRPLEELSASLEKKFPLNTPQPN